MYGYFHAKLCVKRKEDGTMESSFTANISEYIIEKSLTNLGTCAAICSLITEPFKMFFLFLRRKRMFRSLEEIIKDLKDWKIVYLSDNEDLENEIDMICLSD